VATSLVSEDTVLRTGTYRAIPEAAVDKAGSVVTRKRRVVSRRCVAVAATMAGLARKVILSRVPTTTVGGDFVKASAEEAALHL
jgi:hypothetical protein